MAESTDTENLRISISHISEKNYTVLPSDLKALHDAPTWQKCCPNISKAFFPCKKRKREKEKANPKVMYCTFSSLFPHSFIKSFLCWEPQRYFWAQPGWYLFYNLNMAHLTKCLISLLTLALSYHKYPCQLHLKPCHSNSKNLLFLATSNKLHS